MSAPLSTPRPSRLRLAELRDKWGWFVGLGAALVVVGAIAMVNTLAATIASIYTIAFLMLLAGAIQIVQAFGMKSWSNFFLWLLAGVVYALGAIFALLDPILASTVLTLLLAAALAAGGVIRIAAGLGERDHQGWGWVVFSGVLKLLAGIVIALGWPVNSLWVLGLFLAVDLLMQGWAMIALGLALRRR